MLVQLSRCFRDNGIAAPLLERLELLQAQVLAELIHGADAPATCLLHTHNFDNAERFWCTAGAVGTGALLSGVLQDFGEVVVGEGAIGLALETRNPSLAACQCDISEKAFTRRRFASSGQDPGWRKS